MSRRRQTLVQIFAIPTALSVATLAGLLAGLLGDGGFDAAAALGIGLPVAVIAWALTRR